jgi:hypothetical protein
MATTPVEADFWDFDGPVEARAKLAEALRYELLGRPTLKRSSTSLQLPVT